MTTTEIEPVAVRDPDLGEEIAALLNRFSRENASNTPDFILANYLLACLAAYESAVVSRDDWYGANMTQAATDYLLGREP